jgi:predicted kinase
MQRVIILRGTPASGKSAIAKSYRNFEQKVVWLKVDNFKVFFADDSSLALEFVNGSAITTLKYLLDEGFSVVMEGVFQNTITIDHALKIAKDVNIVAKVFELEAPLEILQKRDILREGVPEGKRPALGKETIEKIYNIIKDSPFPNAIKLNTNENTLEECKQLIDNSY